MNSESGEAHEKSKANDGTDKVPSIPSNTPPITDVPPRNAKNETTNQTDWQRRHYRVQLMIGFIGTLAVIIYACQLNEMRKSTQAATDAIKLARDNSHLDQRAWVAQGEILGKPELDEPYRITVRIKNTGKTFAKRCSSISAARIQQLSDPYPDFEKVVGEEATGVTTPRIVPPNGTFVQVLEINKGAKMTQQVLGDLKTPTVVVLVFGKLTYLDIFDCEHWTTFCCRAYTDGTFETYGPYNDADDNRCP